LSRLLFLFDVDGTLFLAHDGIYVRAALAAFEDVYGLSLTADELTNYPGTTPLFAGRMELRKRGLPEKRVHDWCHALAGHYVELLDEAAPGAWEAAPGAAQALEQLAPRARHVLATGNPEPIARARMERIGLARFFGDGGSFGCEAEDRERLNALALARAGNWPRQHAIAVGDTPRDVDGAHVVGIRCVAVTSGRYGPDELAGADALIDDLTELPAAVDRLTT
jgi:phosphoglycolate phosphatase-like HAD superfamily hydrolase